MPVYPYAPGSGGNPFYSAAPMRSIEGGGNNPLGFTNYMGSNLSPGGGGGSPGGAGGQSFGGYLQQLYQGNLRRAGLSTDLYGSSPVDYISNLATYNRRRAGIDPLPGQQQGGGGYLNQPPLFFPGNAGNPPAGSAAPVFSGAVPTAPGVSPPVNAPPTINTNSPTNYTDWFSQIYNSL